MEASGKAESGELGSERAQHSYVIHPQEVREAADLVRANRELAKYQRDVLLPQGAMIFFNQLP